MMRISGMIREYGSRRGALSEVECEAWAWDGARITEMREKENPVSLGTDSVASNNVVDMFEEMRSAIFLQRTLTGRVDALVAATLSAWRRLTARDVWDWKSTWEAWNRKASGFRCGGSGRAGDSAGLRPDRAMVYSASRSDVRATFLAGRAVSVDDSEDRSAGEIAKAADECRVVQSKACRKVSLCSLHAISWNARNDGG